ncbi:MAG: signal peptidase I [Alphaproteobacteria bacterium]|uniref:signal peptidase I n=1 Tax=Brevundimonas sp. TaxID=1871086 RepID=UPI001E0EE9A8|nr:signal peptidase I [Alphaproteobacteria bacterium]MBU1519790.1 signal peptidase I [Alphaproteobacteria bacterium]MBU2031316.1 signal peptidase I [Alphaproteobacteria bacterium]MBU2163344.1 signal peptidase I [Alphaproteobacteria bacterium]MBU2230642.1 signal peptidase I [Alphaproteobacteria bacterium]
MTQTPASSADAPPLVSSLREVREIGVTLAAALILAMAIRILLFQPFTIPSSSMEPGLVTGDYIVVSKYAYGWSRASLPFNPPLPDGRVLGRQPKQGDVVVFRRPHDPDQVWIKRVIGLPGDTVEVRRGQVFVNGRLIGQTPLQMVSDHDGPQRRVLEVRETLSSGKTYVTYDGGPDHPGDDTPIYRVPAGQYFMMGDNRDNSLDSRWPADLGVGLLPAENIVGRAEIVAASWKPGAGLFKPWTWLNLQWGRFLKPIR